MAIRRMFSREVVDTDAFLDMPATSQRLYFFLGIFADDEGFLKNPRSVIRQIGGSNDDLNMLIFKGFVIPFDSGVVVITHWKMNNYIQKDRFKPTTCVQEKALLLLDKQGAYVKKDNGYSLDTSCIQTAYSLDTPKKSAKIDENHSVDTPCIQPVYNQDTQVSLGKVREGEGDARTREASPPAPPASEMTQRISNHQHAEQIIRRYGLPDNDPTLEAVLEDAEAHGWEKLEAALQTAALSNSRQKISVVFYRSILTAEPRKEPTHARADPYANAERF